MNKPRPLHPASGSVAALLVPLLLLTLAPRLAPAQDSLPAGTAAASAATATAEDFIKLGEFKQVIFEYDYFNAIAGTYAESMAENRALLQRTQQTPLALHLFDELAKAAPSLPLATPYASWSADQKAVWNDEIMTLQDDLILAIDASCQSLPVPSQTYYRLGFRCMYLSWGVPLSRKTYGDSIEKLMKNLVATFDGFILAQGQEGYDALDEPVRKHIEAIVALRPKRGDPLKGKGNLTITEAALEEAITHADAIRDLAREGKLLKP